MQRELKDFLKTVMKKNNKLNGNVKITRVKNENVYIIDDDCMIHFKYKPTLLKIDHEIIFNMHFEQALYYLENNYCELINDFNSLLNEYIKIYNEIQKSYNIKEIAKYIKIKYNLNTNSYNVYFIFYKNNFYKREDRNNPHNPFYAAIRAAMRCDPDVIMAGELREANYNENTLLSKENGIMIFDNVINNLIYSSGFNQLDNIFNIDNDGKYKNNELFDAIQSYFEITESTEYTILDPYLINDKVKLNEFITLSRMVDI